MQFTWIELCSFWIFLIASACCQHCPPGSLKLLDNGVPAPVQGISGKSGCLPGVSLPGGLHQNQGVHSDEELPHPGLGPDTPSLVLGAPWAFVTASFEVLVVLICNTLIVPLISLKLHEKYNGPDHTQSPSSTFAFRGLFAVDMERRMFPICRLASRLGQESCCILNCHPVHKVASLSRCRSSCASRGFCLPVLFFLAEAQQHCRRGWEGNVS